MSALVTAIGWVGAVLCLTAYLMVTTGRWAPTSGRYQLVNVVSALMMGTIAASSGVWPSAVTNVVWAVIGAHAVAAVLRTRRSRARGGAEVTTLATAPAPASPTPAATDEPAMVDLAA
ncbi:CBU_0592 family membrane protein [Cellulomonas hominis]